ncbi:caspase, EACC1-associated type [Actinophytocola gossypii]|uniref:Caspase family protein n=1 Tax=Actinophytocola gossypii TaxID=2812003 RepID=A0ABT2JLI2_9PSEU|nr:P-loop NTPase fold protein [Actinophytocola gossypii]MCT2588250.1 caspase family protein [Actinophytocola gossypii]
MNEDEPRATAREAVLIGVSSYSDTEMPDLPQIRNNLQDLAQVLEEQGGFRTTVIQDPDDPIVPATTLSDVAETADVLVVYYSGHGLVDDHGHLNLATTRTNVRLLHSTALSAEQVAHELQGSRARVRILILDCAYSGRAILPATKELPTLEPHGAFLLASSGPNEIALAPAGELYTAFTGELIRSLRQGIPDAGAELALDDVYEAVRRRLVTLGYPAPVARGDASAGRAPLVRNLAGGGPPPPTSHRPALAEYPDSFDPTERVGSGEEDLDWSDDNPAEVDLLNRGPLATVIGMRLVEMHATRPSTSFLLHLDGPWGSGKSTLLNLMEARLGGFFRVARFDAWRQSRLAPAWWSLLTVLRAEIRSGRSWWRRPLLRVSESVARVRRTGAPYLVALALVAAVAAGVGMLIWPSGGAVTGWEQPLKAITALAAALATLTGGALLAARLLLWDSVRGARLFEQTQSNPMADIAAHFRWLLERSDKPVVFFVDDLDRCDQTYVVDLLDTVQTLVRASSDPRERARRAAYFVVAADGAWLRRGYEARHEQFTKCADELGTPLGYLFLDKLFQLTVPMPALTGAAQSAFLDNMLRIAAPTTSRSGVADPAPAPQTRRRISGLEARLRAFEEGQAASVVTALSTAAERGRAEHTLRKFASVLGDNPRSVKKFVNTFSLLRSIRFLEDSDVDPDALALWSLVVVRWPDVAHHLSAHPDAVAGILEPLWCADHFPERLRIAAASEDLRAIIRTTDGGPLTANVIRKCCGAPHLRP